MASIGTSLVKSAVKSVTSVSSANRKLLLAAIQPSEIPKTVRVCVRELEFDSWLKMYFSKYVAYYASDPGNCKTGDVVLIEELQEKKTRDITHQIVKLVYPLGDMTDPITGRKCVGTQFRDDSLRLDEIWGKNPKAFDYDTAPPRGWQEGRRDWSHKKPYRKFHEFTDRDQGEASW